MQPFKISVVTISFNQAAYLQECIDSVARQSGNWEHIIVDSGSTDGPRKIIERNKEHFAHIIFEEDEGPADGLNKGFAKAAGYIFYYLNADDIVLDGAFLDVCSFFSDFKEVDVVSGHGFIINEKGFRVRKVWSDNVSRFSLAHGGSILIQPSTFIRREAFLKTDGFSVANTSNWDGELVLDLFALGLKFKTLNRYWSGYRIHSLSITGSGRLDGEIQDWGRRRYVALMGRDPFWYSFLITSFFRFLRLLRHPDALFYRISGMRVYKSKRS